MFPVFDNHLLWLFSFVATLTITYQHCFFLPRCRNQRGQHQSHLLLHHHPHQTYPCQHQHSSSPKNMRLSHMRETTPTRLSLCMRLQNNNSARVHAQQQPATRTSFTRCLRVCCQAPSTSHAGGSGVLEQPTTAERVVIDKAEYRRNVGICVINSEGKVFSAR